MPHLPGYEHFRPVRIGNAAHEQFQLDVFGEVMDVLHQCWRIGLDAGDMGWRLERAFVDFLEWHWQEPDSGIWEVRGPRRHFTHSKVMAGVAMDRVVKAVERFGLRGAVDRWRQVRDRIHSDVCGHGYDADLGSFVQYFESKPLDAAMTATPAASSATIPKRSRTWVSSTPPKICHAREVRQRLVARAEAGLHRATRRSMATLRSPSTREAMSANGAAAKLNRGSAPLAPEPGF